VTVNWKPAALNHLSAKLQTGKSGDDVDPIRIPISAVCDAVVRHCGHGGVVCPDATDAVVA
jgi:hypothetical protein